MTVFTHPDIDDGDNDTAAAQICQPRGHATSLSLRTTQKHQPHRNSGLHCQEKGSDEDKPETLRKIVVATISGNSQPALLMPIVQYITPFKNKQLRNYYTSIWSDAIRNDLQHLNEYTRGATLRFLQKISREAEHSSPPSVPTLSIDIPASVAQPCSLFRSFIANTHLSFLMQQSRTPLANQCSGLPG
ncbi:hypothetical protein PISMIDRAFT_11790 [Pisolithus microcarpus 441]|uniref:Uncharacterized protein n=1 Tax=Pisolithus microcarpus 441 TaxID=765257 RepID=A0A0C9YBS6_9AGAM|nr:hypothetical protein PISMIDRAFT_11790 [Pisolithus microcarpus 441]